MSRSVAVLERSPCSENGTVVVVGKESSGKSQLISSLTGRQAYCSNFRGTAVNCVVFAGTQNQFIDAPGIVLQSDTVATSMALQKLGETGKVLLVLKTAQLAEHLNDLLPI